MSHALLVNAKAYCALVGAICVGLLGVYGPETPVGQILTVASIVATAVVTWKVPNADDAGGYYDPSSNTKILGKAVMAPPKRNTTNTNKEN